MLNQKMSTRLMLFALMATVMSVGVYAPAMADSKNIVVQQKMTHKHGVFSKDGRKEMRNAIIAGAISGTIRSVLSVYLNNRLIIPYKSVTLPLTNALLVLLEAHIVRKILNNPRGLPLTAVASSAFVSAIALNPQPSAGMTKIINNLFDPLFKMIGWLFSGSAAPTATVVATASITV